MRSVRFNLNFWYIGIFALILCIFSALFYFNVASNLARDADKVLMLRAEGIADTVFAFWRAERATAGFGPGNWDSAPSATLSREVGRGELPALLSRWAEKTGNLDTEHPVRLLDEAGRPLGASPSFTALALPQADAVVKQAQDDVAYRTFTLPGRRIRLITRPVLGGSQLLYFVQCAESLQQMDVHLMRLRTLLLIFIPVMLAATSAIGLTLASKALGPIRSIVARAHRYTTESLHEHIEMPQANDEVELLGATLDKLLVRIDSAFRRLRQFSAAAAHELRTPLTAMKGEIEVTLRKPRTVQEYRHALSTHLATVDDMAQTVEEFLRLAHAEAAEGEAERKLVDLSALAASIGGVFKQLADMKTARIDVSAAKPVWVRGEERLLARLLANLLENAIRYTPSQGTVSIVVQHQEEEAQVFVHDTGSGIAPDQLPHVFDQFFRQRPVNGAHSTGLGLGLCRWIVELHHGHIEVASKPGEGTTVTVGMPLVLA